MQKLHLSGKNSAKNTSKVSFYHFKDKCQHLQGCNKVSYYFLQCIKKIKVINKDIPYDKTISLHLHLSKYLGSETEVTGTSAAALQARGITKISAKTNIIKKLLKQN